LNVSAYSSASKTKNYGIFVNNNPACIQIKLIQNKLQTKPGLPDQFLKKTTYLVKMAI
jgi:hypothetical protein